MKIYHGRRNTLDQLDNKVWIEDGGSQLDLHPRLDLRNHSPTGFEWGYAGSGPAQLALAILADCYGDDDFALKHYQRFKQKVVQFFRREGWEISEEKIRANENIWKEPD